MFKEIMNCADREMLFQHLTVKALNDVEHVLEGYHKGEIDFIEPRDEFGNPEVGEYQLIINNADYKQTGIELLVMKWVENHESTDYLIECLCDPLIYPAISTIINGKAININMSETKAIVKEFNKSSLGLPPMKTQDEYICPACKNTVGYIDEEYSCNDFCSCCGKKIDWNNAFERSESIDRQEAFREHLNLSKNSFNLFLEALEESYQKSHNN